VSVPLAVLLPVPGSVALVIPYGLPVPKPAPVEPSELLDVGPVDPVPNPLFEFSAMMLPPSSLLA
jgi:hypothetical protein